jgi:hypothetical protein
MSERNKHLAEIIVAGVGLGILGGMGITLRHHRELTHRSVDLHPALRASIDFEQRTNGVGDPTIWAAVHRIHHHFPDATLYPYYRIARAVDWITENPDKADGVVIPKTVPHLDPYVEEFDMKDVLEVGNHAKEYVKNRLGKDYEPPKDYSPAQLEEELYPKTPQYFYPTGEKHKGRYSQELIADILLGDPHSPVRVPPPERNGVRGVLKGNFTMYRRAANMFRARPDLKPEDLQHEDGKNKTYSRYDVLAGIAVLSTAALIRRGKFTPKDVAIAALAGLAIAGVKAGYEVLGGNIVNSFGHAGVLDSRRITRALAGKEYKPKLNPDGTLSADSVGAGFLGDLFSLMTLDEVGGQDEHHNAPEKIAFTSKKGLESLRQAPWGNFLSALAKNKYFPLINPGSGFSGRRPDLPNPAMEIIHRRRIEQNFPSSSSHLKLDPLVVVE